MLILAATSVVRVSYAVPLDPTSFTSLGNLNVASGSITINTDTLAITGAATFTGVNQAQAGGPTIAVFDFSSLNIAAGVTINVIGSQPLALLSQGTMTIASAISLNGGVGGNSGTGNAGLAGAAGGFAGGTGAATGSAGGGPGGGTGFGGSHDGGGGAYGGLGGAGSVNSTGGSSYGDLIATLQGGSGGGGGAGVGGGAQNGGGGGGGAGAIELGAVGTLTIGTLTTNGGDGGNRPNFAGGGGAAGGILIHASNVVYTSLSSNGGAGGSSNGGGGGGGRLAIVGGTLTGAQILTLASTVNGGDGRNDGIAGVVTLRPDLALVQSSQTVNVGITAGQTGSLSARLELQPLSLTVLSGGTANFVSFNPMGSNGTITVQGVHNVGTVAAMNLLQLGGGSTSTGTYLLSGSGALNAYGTVVIGNDGTGFFNQSGGTHLLGNGPLDSFLYIGTNPGSNGTYLLSGTGQLDLLRGTEFVGYAGAGTFIQSGGAHHMGTGSISGDLLLGEESTGSGTYLLSGGSLNVSGQQVIGRTGTGMFIQSGGTNSLGSVGVPGEMLIGMSNLPTSTGTYQLTGGTLSTIGIEIVGHNGVGTFVHSGGLNTIGSTASTLSMGRLHLGEGSSGFGTYLLSGAGALQLSGTLEIGTNGSGFFNQSGGTNTIGSLAATGTLDSALYIGRNAGSDGTYLLSGGALSVFGTEYIGNASTGTFIQNGGVHNVGGTTSAFGHLHLGEGTASNGVYLLNGGSLNVVGTLTVGHDGTGVFNQSDGIVNSPFGFVLLARNAGSDGTYELSGSGVLNARHIRVGYGGAGTFIQTGGIFNLGSGTLSGVMLVGSGTGSSGNYFLSGGQLNTVAQEIIAEYSAGTIDHTGGTHIIGSPASLGTLQFAPGSAASGTYLLSGSGALSVFGTAKLGGFGTGNFIQTGGIFSLGSSISTATLILGEFPAAKGTYQLSGSSTFNAFGNEYIGPSGAGTFIQSGGIHTLGSATIAGSIFVGSGGAGRYQLAGGTLNTFGTVAVGSGTGAGTFTQTAGVHNVGPAGTAGTLILGQDLGSVGNYLLSGTGQLNSVRYEIIGFAGAGTFNQSGGVNNVGLITTDLRLGETSTGSGTYLLSGGSLNIPTSFGGVTIGRAGTGFFGHSGGTVNFSSFSSVLVLGALNGANGTYSLSNSGVLNALRVVVSTNATNGTFIQTGGAHNIGNIGTAGFLDIGDSSSSSGSYLLSGTGSINAFGSIAIGNAGTGVFNQSAGTLTLGGDTSAATLAIGQVLGSNGTYLLSGTGQLNGFGTEMIGNGGAATFNHSAGTHTLGSPTVPAAFQMGVANSGVGRYLLSGTGLVEIYGNETIGHGGGNATFSHTGGTHSYSSATTTFGRALYVGHSLNSNGTYLLSGSGILSATGWEIIGESGNGTFIQSGGTHTLGSESAAGTLYIGRLGGTGNYRLSGGILNIIGNNFVGYLGQGTFNHSGGTMNLGSGTVAGMLAVGLGSGAGTYLLSGTGILNTIGAEEVGQFGSGRFFQSAGRHTVTGSITLAANAGSAGTYSLSGGTLQVDGELRINSGGTFLFSGGTFNVDSLNLKGTTGTGGRLLVAAAANRVAVTKSLSIESAALLDLTDNKMVIDYSTLGSLPAAVRQLLQSGDLTSSLATSTRGLGYADNALLNFTEFGAIPVDTTSLLIKYTYLGDSNLDGQVDIADLYALASNYNTSGQFWTAGDYNYDGNVNVADLTLLAQNWQAGVGAPLSQSYLDFALASLGLPAIIVPEPGAILSLAGSVLLLRRRRQPVRV